MKHIIVTAFTLMVLGTFLIINPAFAGERVKVFEMAESGITIEFKMTPEEIAAEDARRARQLAAKKSAENNSPQRFHVYEMAESGQTFSFPMTPDEIAAQDAQNVNRVAISKRKSEAPRKQVVVFELAESGITIEFPVEPSGKFVLEAIAEEKASDDSKM